MVMQMPCIVRLVETRERLRYAFRLRTYPQGDNTRNKELRLGALEQHVGQRLKDRVRHEEDGERGVVLVVAHVEGFLQAFDLCVSDIAAVQKGGEIEQRQPGDQPEVQFPEQLAVLHELVARRGPRR